MDLETDDPQKGQLLQKSAHHRELLEGEVKLISEKTEKIITNALIIGGALALTYFLVSRVSDPREKHKAKSRNIKLVQGKEEQDDTPDSDAQSQEAGIVSQIGAALVAQATTYLLSMAREKLAEFLQSQTGRKENNHEHS